MASVSPRTFLELPELLSDLKRRASYDDITRNPKRVKLDPPALPSEKTMDAYRERVGTSRLTVDVPYNHLASSFQEDIEKLKEKVARLEAKEHQRDEMKIITFGANLLTACLKKLAIQEKSDKNANDPSHSTSSLSKLASSVNSKTFSKATNLPSSCYKLIKKYPSFVEERNKEAHETEVSFAKLLTSEPFYLSRHYHEWGPFFAYVYGKTVDEMANNTAKVSLIDYD